LAGFSTFSAAGFSGFAGAGFGSTLAKGIGNYFYFPSLVAMVRLV